MENDLFLNFANVANNNGYSLSVVGLSIVFTTLLITALFVGSLPSILKLFDCVFGSKSPDCKTEKEDEAALAIAIAINKKN